MEEIVIEVVKVVVAAVFGGGIIAQWQAWKKDKSHAPHDTARLMNSLMEEVAKSVQNATDAMKKAADAEEKADAANRKAVAADRRAERAEEMVHVFRHVVARHVVGIIDWIDQGASPPPPVVAKELRDFVSDMRDM